MATIIKANGERVEANPADSKKFSLEEAQEIVGGYVQVLRLDKESILLVNEDGKLIGLPINSEVTRIMHKNYSLSVNDFIVGDVLLCKNKEF